MRKVYFIILFLSISFSTYSQTKRNLDSLNVLRARIVAGDTTLISEIPEVKIFPSYGYKSWFDKWRYQRLVRNVKAAYPYAKIAGVKLKDIDARLASMQSDRQRKAFIEFTENELRDEFESALRGLTITQGRILIKLIYRETENTTYQILKDLKGNFSASFWQTVARIFGNNLKSKYDPYNEDLMIELIINMIEVGQI